MQGSRKLERMHPRERFREGAPPLMKKSKREPKRLLLDEWTHSHEATDETDWTYYADVEEDDHEQ